VPETESAEGTSRADMLQTAFAALLDLRNQARARGMTDWWLKQSDLTTLGYANLATDIIEHLRAVGWKAGDPVLDWGAGPGYLTFALETLGQRMIYYEFDNDAPAYVFVRDHLKAEKHYIGDDPVAIPFGNESFAGVVSFGVLEHVPDMPGSVAEVMRVLRPGGLFFVYHFPNRYSWTETAATVLGRSHHDVRLTRRQLQSLVCSEDAETLHVDYRYLIPRNLIDMPRLRGMVSDHAERVFTADASMTKVPGLRLLSTTHDLVVRKSGPGPQHS
jgi:SAM-dependent methyltransferase